MTSRRNTHESTRTLRAAILAGRRIMLVDSDASRVTLTRQWIEWEGGPEAEVAGSGDEALDVLGAKAQRFDVVAVWPWLTDDATVDLFGVLRRCASPVRLVAVTSLSPAELGRAGRLAGAAAVEATGEPRRLLATLHNVLAGQDTVGGLIHRRCVPATLSAEWAEAIYGTSPGHSFHAALD